MKILTARVGTQKLIFATCMLKVIAHVLRLAIFDVLHQFSKLWVLEIQEKLGLEKNFASQPHNITHHKGVLLSYKIGKTRFFNCKI